MGIIRKVFGSFIDYRVDRWLSFGTLKSVSVGVKNQAKGLFIPKKATYSETYEEAKQRLNLSEDDITARIKTFLLYTRFFVFLAIIIFGYAIYKFAMPQIMAGISALCVGAYMLCFAFRYHFWVIQMRQKRLGLSLREYFQILLK